MIAMHPDNGGRICPRLIWQIDVGALGWFGILIRNILENKKCRVLCQRGNHCKKNERKKSDCLFHGVTNKNTICHACAQDKFRSREIIADIKIQQGGIRERKQNLTLLRRIKHRLLFALDWNRDSNGKLYGSMMTR
jgi:hypothetical protein